MDFSKMRDSIGYLLVLRELEGVSAVERAVLNAIGRPICYHTRLTCTEQDTLPILAWCDPARITDSVSLPESVFSAIRLDEPIVGCCGGAWDRFRDDMREWILYTSLQERFLRGTDWEETEYYRTGLAAIERGQPAWNGLESEAELRERCRYIDRLYDNIRNDGYRPQTRETLFGDESIPDELRAGIGRDGSILRLGGGRHRLFIAQLLDVERIPILIMLVHKRWDALDDHEDVSGAIASAPHLSRDDHPLLHSY